MRRPALILPFALALLACPGSGQRRGREAMKQVADLHREIGDAHRKAAQDFARQPGAAEALDASKWPGCPLADPDGVRISRSLLKGYLDLQSAPEGEARLACARSYVARLASNADAAAASLRQASPADPASPQSRVYAAALVLEEVDASLARRCLARLEALGHGQ